MLNLLHVPVKFKLWWRKILHGVLPAELFRIIASMPLGLIVFQVGDMSRGEMLCRWRVKKRGGEDRRIFTAGPVIGT